jgi:hypothetical protein
MKQPLLLYRLTKLYMQMLLRHLLNFTLAMVGLFLRLRPVSI